MPRRAPTPPSFAPKVFKDGGLSGEQKMPRPTAVAARFWSDGHKHDVSIHPPDPLPLRRGAGPDI